MKHRTETLETALSAQATDECSARIRDFCEKLKLPKRDALRYAMTAEEILLDASADTDFEKFRLTTGTKFFRPFMSLELPGKQFNAFASREGSILGDGILKNLGLSPEYTYSGGSNVYSFRIRKKALNPFVTLAVSIISAVLLGLLGNLPCTVTLRDALLNNILTPLHDTFLNVLGCIAGPMVFLSVAWGIYGIGDAATIKRIGKNLLKCYTGTVYFHTLIFTLVCLPMFNLRYSSGMGNISELSSVFTMILGIIPKNIFSPFVEGNTLQIIFLAVVIGIAMLFLGKKTSAVAKAVEQINYIVQFLIEFISKLVPYFIFIIILEMIWSNTASSMVSVARLLLICIACIFCMVLLTVLYTSFRMKVSPVLLIKKGIPTFVIALTTASSAAAFGTNISACKKEYGIHDTISSFGLPLGMVTLKPATAINYLTAALFFAEMYNIDVSFSWIVTVIFSAGILAIATPPIPGGAMTAYTVLFTQLGIPAEALAIALACDAVFDFIDTGCDQFILPLVMLPQAKKMGLSDYTVLKKTNSK